MLPCRSEMVSEFSEISKDFYLRIRFEGEIVSFILDF